MDENYIRQRIDQILRQKIAMGGCGDQGCDMMYATGVNVGGRRRSRRRGGVLLGGYGNRKGALKAAKNSPWIQFVQDYKDRHGITYKQALLEAGPEYKRYKKIGEQKKTGKHKPKPKPKHKPKPKPKPKLQLTARQKSRVNKYYKTKVKSGPHKDSCFKYDPNGVYYLNDEYNCVRTHKTAKKKR